MPSSAATSGRTLPSGVPASISSAIFVISTSAAAKISLLHTPLQTSYAMLRAASDVSVAATPVRR